MTSQAEQVRLVARDQKIRTPGGRDRQQEAVVGIRSQRDRRGRHAEDREAADLVDQSAGLRRPQPLADALDQALTARAEAEQREAFLAGGEANLKARDADARDEELARLKQTLGEMTLRVELQRDAIRRLKAGLPLDETRWPQ